MGILEDLITQPQQDRASYAPFWPQELGAKQPVPVKQATSAVASTFWDLSLMPLGSLKDIAGDIKDLASKSVEANLFFETEFAMAALPRMGRDGILLLCLWEGVSSQRILRFFMPVILQKKGIPRHLVFSSYWHDFAPLGTPLLHRENAAETAETLLRLLGDPALDLSGVTSFEQQKLDGKTVQYLSEAARRLGLQYKTLQVFERGTLVHQGEQNPDEPPYLRKVMGGRRHKEYERLLRRLREKGDVTFEVARKQNAVLNAVEEFLTLEASGWKGRSGTALHSLKQIAALCRQAVNALAQVGRCEIHLMRFDGRAISSLICFNSGDEYYSWKMAFDEDFEHYSPGAQIAMKTTEYWLNSKKFRSVDSLASANNSLINKIWPDRLEIGTLLIGTGNQHGSKIAAVARSLERYDGVKRNAKAVLQLVRRGK